MPSNFVGFEVQAEAADGTLTPVSLATVGVYDITHDDELDPLTADGDGRVDAGSLDVAAGTAIRFYVDLGNGEAGFAEQTTT